MFCLSAQAPARPESLPVPLRGIARGARILCASALLSAPLAAHAQPAAPGASTTMPVITVTGEADNSNTENSGSFAAKKARLFKGIESIRDIPQPVTVMTRQFLDERALLDLHDVLQNTPGVTVDYVDSERVTYFSRGYAIDALQVDGLTINQSGSAFIQPDTAVLDRVEVLRGASGMLRGSGNPSATVNMVRKRPTAEFQGSVGLTLGSWERRRLEADLGGALNAAGSVRGRIVAVNDEKEFYQKGRSEDRKVFYGVVEADLGKRTMLTASLQHTDLDATGAWGNLPGNLDGTPLALPRETYLGADWNRWNRYNTQAFTELEHRFDNDWSVKVNAAYTQLHLKENGFKQTYMVRPARETNPYLMSIETAQYTGAASDQLNIGATANGPFTAFGRKHTLVLGAEGTRNKSVDSWGQGSLYPTMVDIRSFDPSSTYPERDVPMTARKNTPSTISQKAAFATASLSVTDPLTLLLGARVSWWESESPAAPASNYAVNREVTPFAGLVYAFNKQISAYASYTEIFTPQNIKGANGAILDPIRGEDVEAGLKGEFLGGRLNASAGVFRINNVGKGIEDSGSVNPCLPYFTTGYCRIAGGKTQSEGWEMEVSGQLMTGWQVMAGYTNTRTRYLADSNASNVGQPLRSIDPRHLVDLFTSYKPGGALQGLTVGGGAQIQSEASVKAGAITSRQGGYAVYNAMLSYQIGKLYSVQANVNNLFDKTYYKKFGPTGIAYYYGDPRSVSVSLRANF
ncbi:TonB-dependent siderophore receptor [Massilia violaceinigra]|uniref:TonB-dependent siderophore receptor n=1 Tax=Massilia violaceinigra TaxID=2045208 RepID=A0ABY4A8W5_9BURK|nr:TonB-dependent siderophore receptor [Massilia violaceinigra]UOD31250.1 TonB-dependent siderophore receptor [Massilia violaceinigra]